MLDPYPHVGSWVVPAGAVDATLDAIAPTTARGIEGGVFWVGRRAEVSVVQAVIVPVVPGVVGHADGWMVSPEVFGAATTWATERGYSLLAICHTHLAPGAAQISLRDRTHSVKAPGVLAVVIGSGGKEPDPTCWGWYVWEDGDYRELLAPERGSRFVMGGAGTTTVVQVSSRGVQL